MVRKVTSRKYEKEIRPRIKLYKFENLSEDVQEKIINSEIEFREDILLDDLSQVGTDILTEYLVKNGIEFESTPKVTSWDLSENYIHFKFSGQYKKYYIDYNSESYSDAESADIPEKIYYKFLDIVDKAKKEALKAMKADYNYSTDPEYIKRDLIEQGNLYTVNGEFKEQG